MAATDPTTSQSCTASSPPLRVGAPEVHGPLAVFPVFGPPSVLEYVAFADGCARGLSVNEMAGGASVNDLVVSNPTDDGGEASPGVRRARIRRASRRR